MFFKHDYTPLEIDELLARRPWEVVIREFATPRNPRIEQWFTTYSPWTYVTGPFLRFVCPSNFETSGSATLIERAGEGVAYFHVRKPAATTT